MKLLLATKSLELEITSPAGYVASAARSESIDEIRRRKRKRTFPLPLDQDGELSQGKVLFPVQQGMRDPAIEYELKEWITEVIDVVVQLPQKQVYAIVCAMKDEVEDTSLLAEPVVRLCLFFVGCSVQRHRPADLPDEPLGQPEPDREDAMREVEVGGAGARLEPAGLGERRFARSGRSDRLLQRLLVAR